jgi:hypothetical protein
MLYDEARKYGTPASTNIDNILPMQVNHRPEAVGLRLVLLGRLKRAFT